MIPVYINVFNRLTTTRNLVEQVRRLHNAEPVIVDNASDYQPLLDWYDTRPCEVTRLKVNLGHHAPWLSGEIQKDNSPVYAVTDCDIDIDGVPADVLSVLSEPFAWRNSRPVKSGLALRIDDLPDWQTEVKAWEKRWWAIRIACPSTHTWYRAAIDTTFALHTARTTLRQVQDVARTAAVRLAGPYQARHMPWYLDCENLDEENRNYFATASGSNSWKPSGKSLAASYAGGPRHAPWRR